MKSVLVLLLTLSFSLGVSAQDQTDKKARAYYFVAERALSENKYDAALSAISKTEDLLGGANASTAAMKVKIYFKQKNYIVAKQAIEKFYEFDAGDALSREMSEYMLKIEDNLEIEKERIEKTRLANIAANKKAKQDEINRKNNLRAKEARELKALINSCRPAEQGKDIPMTCVSLAYRYAKGDGLTKDMEKATAIFNVACIKASSQYGLCANAGYYISQGHGNFKEPQALAFDLYKRGCDAGESNSCNNLGIFYLLGVNKNNKTYIEKSTSMARAAFDKSCKKGRKDACERVKSTGKDNSELLIGLEKACEKKNSEQCYTAGQWLLEGKNISKNTSKAATYFSKACNLKNYSGCHELGKYQREGYEENYVGKALSNFALACNLGKITSACGDLEKLIKDIDSEVTPLKDECSGGKASSCVYLAEKYDDGLSIPLNDRVAADFYLKGCDLGNARSCNIYGVMNKNGEGIPKNYKVAFQYFTKGCDGGYFKGCANLGVLYQKGEGVAKDIPLAEGLMLNACKDGALLGCENLMLLHKDGLGKKKNNAEIVMLMRHKCKTEKDNKNICAYKDLNEDAQMDKAILKYQKKSYANLVKKFNGMGTYTHKYFFEEKWHSVKIKTTYKKSNDLCVIKNTKRIISIPGEDTIDETEDFDLRFTSAIKYAPRDDYIDYEFSLTNMYDELTEDNAKLKTKTPYCAGTFCAKKESYAKQLLTQVVNYHKYFCS